MNSTIKSPYVFPNGIIDIFKQLKVTDLNILNVNYKGEVSCIMVRIHNLSILHFNLKGSRNWKKNSENHRNPISREFSRNP